MRIRDCPAAVSGNDRRHDALGAPRPGKRRPVGGPAWRPRPRVRRPARCPSRARGTAVRDLVGGSADRHRRRPSRRAAPGCLGSRRRRTELAKESSVTRTRRPRPRATVHGYPRQGAEPGAEEGHRGLLGRAASTPPSSRDAAAALRRANWRSCAAPASTRSRAATSRYYDHVLDTAWLLGAVPRPPPRAVPASASDGDLDRYFAMARGTQRRRAAGDDEVVRHQLPLPGPRVGPDTAFAADAAQAGRRAHRGARGRRRAPARCSSGRSRTCCWPSPHPARPQGFDR